MKRLICSMVAVAALASNALASPPRTEEERKAALATVEFRTNEAVVLPASGATLRIPPNAAAAIGNDAKVISEVVNGTDAPASIEAVLYDQGTGELVYYQKFGGGYVSLSDWSEVDADRMIRDIGESTEKSNSRRAQNGIPGLHVVGWVEKPHLDRATNTVRWAIEARDDANETTLNSIALALGRDGYEKLTWVGSKEAFAEASSNLLDKAHAAFSFANGTTYSDFRTGDTVAAYGIAGLVTTMAGAKIATKVGLLTFLAVFGKKLGVLVALPIILVVGLARKRLGRRQAPTPT